MTTTRAPGGEAQERRHSEGRAAKVAAAAFLASPVAWILSLGLTYVIQDYACSAAVTAGAPTPDGPVFVVLMVLNAVLLLLITGAGVVGFLVARRSGRTSLPQFLGYGAVALALVCAYGLVLIAVNPIYLEVCP